MYNVVIVCLHGVVRTNAYEPSHDIGRHYHTGTMTRGWHVQLGTVGYMTYSLAVSGLIPLVLVSLWGSWHGLSTTFPSFSSLDVTSPSLCKDSCL